MSLPSDPFILLSYINTKLRDFYPSLDEFCKANDVDRQSITQKLEAVGFSYHAEQNQFK